MDPAEKPKRASEWDREYMKRLGEYQDESHAEAIAGHLASSGSERTEAAISAMMRGPFFPSRLPDDDDPAQFYERARRLGLIRGK